MPFKLFIRSNNKFWISFFRTVIKKTVWKYKTMRLFLRIYQDSKMIGKRCYWAKNKRTPGEPVLPFLDLFLNPRGSLLYHRLCWRKPKKMRFVHISNSHRGRNTRGENWMLWKGQSKESAVFPIILRQFLVIFSTTTFISFTKLKFRQSSWGAEQV